MTTMVRCLSGILILGVVLSSAVHNGMAAMPTPPAEFVTVPSGSPVEIAVAFFNSYSDVQDAYDATQMAIDDYGPIKGFAIQRNSYDAGCSESEGVTVANAIAANVQNTGLVGPFCSVSTRGAAPILESYSIVMISPSNTAQDLYNYGPGVFNRVVPPDPDFETWDQWVSQLASVDTWRSQFAALYGHSPTTLAVYAYDATRLLLKSIDEISNVDGSGNLVIKRSALQAAVRNTFTFPGVTGTINLNVFGDRISILKETVWGDAFSYTTLGSGWSWEFEEPSYWSLSANSGFMQITTQQALHNLLLCLAPVQDYEMRTMVYFTPTENFQFAGLAVYLDPDNRLTLGRAYAGGNNIYFDHWEGGSLTDSNYATPTTELTITYLRLVRLGENYSGYFSADGLNWVLLGSHSPGFKSTKVGLYASNQNQPVGEIPADFNFFVLQRSITSTYLPITIK